MALRATAFEHAGQLVRALFTRYVAYLGGTAVSAFSVVVNVIHQDRISWMVSAVAGIVCLFAALLEVFADEREGRLAAEGGSRFVLLPDATPYRPRRKVGTAVVSGVLLGALVLGYAGHVVASTIYPRRSPLSGNIVQMYQWPKDDDDKSPEADLLLVVSVTSRGQSAYLEQWKAVATVDGKTIIGRNLAIPSRLDAHLSHHRTQLFFGSDAIYLKMRSAVQPQAPPMIGLLLERFLIGSHMQKITPAMLTLTAHDPISDTDVTMKGIPAEDEDYDPAYIPGLRQS